VIGVKVGRVGPERGGERLDVRDLQVRIRIRIRIRYQ
jgi:hypothetical protein